MFVFAAIGQILAILFCKFCKLEMPSINVKLATLLKRPTC